MTTVYILWHRYEPEPEVDEEKLLGIYSSEERAREAITRLKDQPGFRDHPKGFAIERCKIDNDGWQEGFVRVGPNEW